MESFWSFMNSLVDKPYAAIGVVAVAGLAVFMGFGAIGVVVSSIMNAFKETGTPLAEGAGDWLSYQGLKAALKGEAQVWLAKASFQAALNLYHSLTLRMGNGEAYFEVHVQGDGPTKEAVRALGPFMKTAGETMQTLANPQTRQQIAGGQTKALQPPPNYVAPPDSESNVPAVRRRRR